MVSFDEFVLYGDLPIYLQIIQYIKQGIISKSILDGDSLPSRRVLSTLLGINPNTIQKAYRILEEEQLLQSQVGAKSTICVTDKQVQDLKKEQLEIEVQSFISSMQSMAITKEDSINLLHKLWEEEK